MSNTAPQHVQDDPAKPYKALAGAISTAVLVALSAYFTGTNDISWHGVLAALVSAAAQFVITFIVRNPKVVTGHTGGL